MPSLSLSVSLAELKRLRWYCEERIYQVEVCWETVLQSIVFKNTLSH